MADNVEITAGANATPLGGTKIATDDIGDVHYQKLKIALGADGVVDTLLKSGQQTMSDSAPVTLASDQGDISIDDGGGSITVDNSVLSIVGGGVEATAQRVTIASDSTGVLSVDDNGGSLTVDNAALSVTGGGVEASAQRVTIANDSTGVLSVDDNAGSLTVDNPVLSVVGGGAEATAQRVTIANDSTGVLSVDDNGGSLTVDQATHDNLNVNANIQVGDVDVAVGNPVPVDVVDHVASSFDHGSNSAIGTGATRFIVASVPATLGIQVKAANGNTANVYVGNSDVTAATVDATDGFELGPGEGVLVRGDDVNKLYGISTAVSQRVFWFVV